MYFYSYLPNQVSLLLEDNFVYIYIPIALSVSMVFHHKFIDIKYADVALH